MCCESTQALWFAQNSLPLRWQRQPIAVYQGQPFSCDLLKIHYLCGDKDNYWSQLWCSDPVVICSKFITFAVTKTTTQPTQRFRHSLWFAQNSLPLRWQRQQLTKRVNVNIRCDLLKIHYLCGDKDNDNRMKMIRYGVVICSKFITFAVTKTTGHQVAIIYHQLWFAQNSLPLRWQRQH